MSKATCLRPRFRVRQRVTAIALPDGVPYPREEITNLTVSNVRLQTSTSLPSYYRVTAENSTHPTHPLVEGAERFFEHA